MVPLLQVMVNAPIVSSMRGSSLMKLESDDQETKDRTWKISLAHVRNVNTLQGPLGGKVDIIV